MRGPPQYYNSGYNIIKSFRPRFTEINHEKRKKYDCAPPNFQGVYTYYNNHIIAVSSDFFWFGMEIALDAHRFGFERYQ